ncbi:MAG: hypothetical protein KAS71_12680, partial [Bacteroidales bacterium]|nr:hypothetical protein [Bacteroidales bacterium]
PDSYREEGGSTSFIIIHIKFLSN